MSERATRTRGGGLGPLAALVTVVLALVALVAIFTDAGHAPTPPPADDAEERAIERGAGHRAALAPGPSSPPEPPIPSVRSILDAGTGAPEAGSASAEAPVPPPAEERPPTPPRVVTLDQEYEATALFLDLLTVRRDNVRTELEAARASGDPRRIQRLEHVLADLDETIPRMITRSHELEARLRERAAEESADSPATDPP